MEEKDPPFYETGNPTSSARASGVAVMVTLHRGGVGVFAVEIGVQGCSEASQPLDTAEI